MIQCSARWNCVLQCVLVSEDKSPGTNPCEGFCIFVFINDLWNKKTNKLKRVENRPKTKKKKKELWNPIQYNRDGFYKSTAYRYLH